jgi:hypothetical protein
MEIECDVHCLKLPEGHRDLLGDFGLCEILWLRTRKRTFGLFLNGKATKHLEL